MAFDCLKKLHKEELYSNVVHLGNLLTTVIDRKSNFFTAQQQYQAFVYYADALYQVGQYKKAGQTYAKALNLLRTRILITSHPAPPTPSSKSRSSSAAAAAHSQNEITAENEVNFRLHLCYVKQNKLREAVGALESIPTNARTPKVNAALGELHRKLHTLQRAKQCYEDLLGKMNLIFVGYRFLDRPNLMLSCFSVHSIRHRRSGRASPTGRPNGRTSSAGWRYGHRAMVDNVRSG